MALHRPEFVTRLAKQRHAGGDLLSRDPRGRRLASGGQGHRREFVLRDVLDAALGNTDNHARNTSVLKWFDGRVALSPLYDFAPMILDRRMIPRVSRWADDRDLPDWNAVADALADTLDPASTRRWLRGLAPAIAELPATMAECGVPDEVIVRCRERIQRVARDLAALRAGKARHKGP